MQFLAWKVQIVTVIMALSSLSSFGDWLGPRFPAEWVKGALVLGLVSSWVVITLFAYLNHQTRKPYLSLWTVAWMFYSVYLAASLSLQEAPEMPLLALVRRTCIGISALFIFWGSLQRTNQRRSLRELGGGVAVIVLWNYVAVVLIRERFWCSLPMFVLLAAAGVYSALPYLRNRRRTRGGTILGVGFLLWSLHLLVVPFLGSSLPAMAGAHLTLTVLALLITVGIVMEEERTMSEQQYRTLFESAAEAILLLDPETLQVLEANRAAQDLAARSLPELAGCHLKEFCPDLFPKEVERTGVIALLALVGKRDGEFHLLRQDGSQVLCEGEAHVVPSCSGTVLQIIARDITERRRWLQELNVKSTAIEAAANAIVISDREGHILWANPAFTQLTGYSLTEAQGHHIWFLMSNGHQPALYKELWDTVLQGRVWSGRLVNRHKDGTLFTEEMTLTPVRDADGRVTNFIAIKQRAPESQLLNPTAAPEELVLAQH
jgi:PAS domain S-box-containing protein